VGFIFVSDIILDNMINTEILSQSSTKTENELSNPDIESQITSEKIEEIKNRVSQSDKLKATNIILKNLSTDEINELRGMIGGSITSAEKTRAKEIIYKNLSEDEINEIKNMYLKYLNE
jgi:hypothetical protein